MTQAQEVFNVISEMIADAKDMDSSDIHADSTLSQLMLDSLDYVEMMVLLKREFNLNINFEQIITSSDMTLGEFCQAIDASNTRKESA